ncbi:hypothetical protein BDV28DRAFT_152067 [Aspergillus coremiiformis]|uniref:Uncharacterized protein n=1 Tax=Aspergillus coremiiformis TaxID=138285 RepID=A0A5N6YUX5_9EURO|nr:hypothetical protein BDV28DRAFT_152067 [Aspergillus coremiiformis]
MFGFPSKRQRGHEELADLDPSAIHERKKPRSLALRTSPKCFQKPSFADANHAVSDLGLSTLTPVESSDDDDMDGYNKHVHAAWKGELPHQAAPNTAMDIDHNRDIVPPVGDENQCLWPTSACSNVDIQPSPIPHNRVNQSLTISQRPAADSPYRYIHPTTSDQDPTPSICNPIQRLPSPVSDSEDAMGSVQDTASDVDMAYNPSRPASFSPSTWLGMEESSPRMQQYLALPEVEKNKHKDSPSKGASSKKKITFSMGFRADCEKCRCKVPGHYSHIIRT